MRRFALLLALGLVGCPKGTPNTTNPEDKLIFDLGAALASNDRATVMGLFDLEVRQKLDFWDKKLKPLMSPEKQLEAYKAEEKRLGDAAVLAPEGEVAGEAWGEVRGKPWAEELAAGKCVSGPPAKEDIGRYVMPKENPKMPQEIGMFIFNLRTTVNWLPAFRVTCPNQGTFWIQMAQRKRGADQKEQPLKIVHVLP